MENIIFSYKEMFSANSTEKILPIITPDYPDMRTAEGMEFFIGFMDLADKKIYSNRAALKYAIAQTDFENNEQREAANRLEIEKIPNHIYDKLNAIYMQEEAKYTDNQHLFEVYKYLVEKLFKTILAKDKDWQNFNWYDPVLPYKLISEKYLEAYETFFRASSSTGQNIPAAPEPESSTSYTEKKSQETETQSQSEKLEASGPVEITVTQIQGE